MFEVNNKETRTMSMTLLLTSNIFHAFFSSVSTVHFEQVNICWVLERKGIRF